MIVVKGVIHRAVLEADVFQTRAIRKKNNIHYFASEQIYRTTPQYLDSRCGCHKLA